MQIGDSLSSAGKMREAIVHFSRSSKQAKLNQKFEDYLVAERALNICYWQIGEIDSVTQRSYRLLEEIKQAHKEENVHSAHLYTQLARANRFYDKPDTALALVNAAGMIIEENNLNNPDLLEAYFLTKGMIFALLLPMDSAVHYTTLALNSRLERFEDENEKVAEAYSNLGIIQLNNRQPVLALEHVEKAYAIRLKLNSPASLSYASNLKNMGNTYFVHEEYEKAMKAYRQAKKMREQVLQKDHILMADVYQNLGNTHNFLTNYDSALYYHRLAVNFYQSDLDKYGPFLGRVTNNIGYVFLRKQEYDKTKVYFDSALRYNRKYLGERSNRVIRNYINLCRVTQGLEEYKEMASYAHRAILANTLNEIQDTSFLNTPVVEQFVTQEYVIGGLNLKGLAFENLYYETNDLKYLKAAAKAYMEACRVLDQLKSTLNSDEDKIAFYRSAKTVFEHGIDVLLQLHELDGDPTYNENAFYVLQLFKNSTLVEANKELYEALENDFPGDLLEKEQQILDAISAAKTSIIKELKKEDPNSIKIRDLRSDLFDLKRLHDQVKQQVRDYNVHFHNIKYGSEQLSIEQLQRDLDSSSMILEYFEGNNSIYCFLTGRNSFNIHKLTSTQELSESINAVNNKLIGETTVDSKLLSEISTRILSPLSITKNVNRLIIIPDGTLWKLNYDLLPLSDTSSQMVIEQFATSYAYSSHLIAAPKKSKSFRKNTLAFSYAEEDDGNLGDNIGLNVLRASNTDLPGTSQEIREISRLREGEYLYGKEASESNFKKLAKDYAILHLALHGQIDDENPSQSNLSFYNEGETNEDGLLYNFEIYNLRLNSSLAVLSACNTGTGQVGSSEGTLSIGRAFAYAGIESLLLSRTEVSDAISPIIIKYFYEGLNAGKTKSEALREAKLKFLERDADKISSNPYYWSSFYILGDDSPIPQIAQTKFTRLNLMLLIGGLVVLLFLVFIGTRKRFQSN